MLLLRDGPIDVVRDSGAWFRQRPVLSSNGRMLLWRLAGKDLIVEVEEDKKSCSDGVRSGSRRGEIVGAVMVETDVVPSTDNRQSTSQYVRQIHCIPKEYRYDNLACLERARGESKLIVSRFLESDVQASLGKFLA
jgi:hypothetical protein